MKSTDKHACAACGEPRDSCVRCKAAKLNEPRRVLGLPRASWLVLILGAAIALALWNA